MTSRSHLVAVSAVPMATAETAITVPVLAVQEPLPVVLVEPPAVAAEGTVTVLVVIVLTVLLVVAESVPTVLVGAKSGQVVGVLQLLIVVVSVPMLVLRQ